MSDRTIRRLHAAYRDDIGDLGTRRPLPGPQIAQLDPFLFLNHHGPQTYPPSNRGLPFGPHPHRGFETVTFILEGSLMHKDSAGHASVIGAGGVQWMTAGRGIIHAEISPPEFLEHGGALEILQLWVNLPARLKMTAPAYVGLQGGEIPAHPAAGATVRLIAGEWEGHRGPVHPLLDMFMAVVEFEPAGSAWFHGLEGRSVFLYVVRGTVSIAGQLAPQYNLVELEDGDTLHLSAVDRALVLVGHAAPLGEPVVAHGPFVMNTREEIVQAIDDYQAGKFGPPM
ncbi:pirin family protein [Pseudoduganella sp. GCM10020061]|uniref:pirin family protein n=1 Tax=Pseudoduganella sp. GCM10020061 TaxID=3317345 RepID=UPI00362DF7AA